MSTREVNHSCLSERVLNPGTSDQFGGRRFALFGMIAAIVWYGCILVFWAIEPLTDSLPVSITSSQLQRVSVVRSIARVVRQRSVSAQHDGDQSELPDLAVRTVPAGAAPEVIGGAIVATVADSQLRRDMSQGARALAEDASFGRAAEEALGRVSDGSPSPRW